MCFSPEVSFTAAALLFPAGAIGVVKAYRTDRRYLAICALPFLFGLQQLFEGLVWRAGEARNVAEVARYSLAYMFFSWLAWPVWVPTAIYFIEPPRRQLIYFAFAILGAILGAGLFLPYLVHANWLNVTFLDRSIIYGGTELFDYLVARNATYVVYAITVILPSLLSTNREIRVFGLLILVVLAVTKIFFSLAYISVFCFGGALMSLYLTGLIFWKARAPDQGRLHAMPHIQSL